MINKMKVTGKITKIEEVKSGTSQAGKDWKKTSFLIDTGEQYDNLYYFDVFGDEKVDNFIKYNKLGRSVEVEFNIRCREYEGKYYTNLSAWKISKANDTETAIEQGAAIIDAAFPPAENVIEDNNDDLPF
jgi:hypothetical protein